MTIAWVLGSGGLLGTALCRALRRKGADLVLPAERFHWASESRITSQLEAAVSTFAACIGTAERWEIYWAAGVSTMGSSERDLAFETRLLVLLLRLVESEARLKAIPGAVAFASSAGAVYAGSADCFISEGTTPAPTTAYGREKLTQENLVRSFADANEGKVALLARLSTLYGPGQSFGKQQGLIAHIARSILRNRPIQIYVPLDTIRDYIAVDDAAASMVAALRARGEGPRVLTKIVASEQPATIAEIISAFRRVARRAPRLVTSAGQLTGIYPRRVQFRSVVAPRCAWAPKTSLLVGIAQVMAAERAAFARGPGA
jgi:UDP-glucose 4-epimerase